MTSSEIPGLTSTCKVFLWNEQAASGRDSKECWRVGVNIRRKQIFLGDRQDPTRTKDLPKINWMKPGIKFQAMQERGSRPWRGPDGVRLRAAFDCDVVSDCRPCGIHNHEPNPIVHGQCERTGETQHLSRWAEVRRRQGSKWRGKLRSYEQHCQRSCEQCNKAFWPY